MLGGDEGNEAQGQTDKQRERLQRVGERQMETGIAGERATVQHYRLPHRKLRDGIRVSTIHLQNVFINTFSSQATAESQFFYIDDHPTIRHQNQTNYTPLRNARIVNIRLREHQISEGLSNYKTSLCKPGRMPNWESEYSYANESSESKEKHPYSMKSRLAMVIKPKGWVNIL